MGKSSDNMMEGMLMGILENESNPYIRQAAAFHEYASEGVLLKAIGDVDYMVRVYALHNQNASARVFTAAMERVRGEQPTQQTRQINELAEGLMAAQRVGGTTGTGVRSGKVTFHVGDETLRGQLFLPATDQIRGAVLFIHGWTDSGESYNAQAKALTKLGYAAITFNLRGHGQGDMKSGAERHTYTPKDSLEDAKVAYDELKKRLGNVHISVVGISYGGYIATQLIKERKVASLVISSPALYGDEDFTTPKEQYRSFKGQVTGPNKAFEALSDFKGKTLLIEAEKDDVVTKQVIDGYVRAGGDNITHKIVAEANHGTTPTDMLTEWFNTI